MLTLFNKRHIDTNCADACHLHVRESLRSGPCKWVAHQIGTAAAATAVWAPPSRRSPSSRARLRRPPASRHVIAPAGVPPRAPPACTALWCRWGSRCPTRAPAGTTGTAAAGSASPAAASASRATCGVCCPPWNFVGNPWCCCVQKCNACEVALLSDTSTLLVLIVITYMCCTLSVCIAVWALRQQKLS